MLKRSRMPPMDFRPVDEVPLAAAPARGAVPRLLIVGPLPPPLGGVQLTIDMQLHSKLASEFELHVVDTSKRRLRWAVESPTWKTPLYFARDFLRLVRALALLRPDVVLVHAAATFSLLRDWMFMAAARIAGARVICHYHGTLHARFPSGETRSGRIAGRMLMAAAHRVIVLSPGYRCEMARAWKRDDLVWAPNMVDVALFRSVSAHARVPWLLPGDRAVLFVGRLSAPKGIYELFDAVPRVIEREPDARFVLVGVAESDAMEQVIRAAAVSRGIAQHLSFLGSLEGRDKAAAFVTSRMIVVPSWTEAFPLVIPEAMAAGLPVVASAVGAIPDFVKDGEDGFLIAPGDAAALADRVCRLLGDEPLRARMSARVRARAPCEFAIEVGCARVAEVARSLLAGSPPSKLASRPRAPTGSCRRRARGAMRNRNADLPP
jgi:glycosyltransferase involved in cell wall biosynthesis